MANRQTTGKASRPLAVCLVWTAATAAHGLYIPREQTNPAAALDPLPVRDVSAGELELSLLHQGIHRSTGLVAPVSISAHRLAWEDPPQLHRQEVGIASLEMEQEQKRLMDEAGLRQLRIYSDQEADKEHKLPKPEITLFKALFGCFFLMFLLATCSSRYLMTVEDRKDVAPPVEEPPPAPKTVLVKATITVTLWMIFSIFFIIFNKYMFSKGGFPYPVTLTAMHMGSCYVVFSFLRLLPEDYRKRIMPDADKHIPFDLYLKGLVPAALLMAICLGIGNLGFLYATVAFIQMVKPVNIVVTSLAGFAWGLEPATPTHVFIAILVSGGVAVAAAGEVEFSLVGLICQLCASTGEGLRLIILQGIMQGSLKLDPLTTLYRFTPVAGLSLCVLSCLIEGPVIWRALECPIVLALNCAMAVCLNILIAAVVQQTSAVVFVLAGVTKDIATIAISAVMYSTAVTGQEVGGYAISMLGICLYKVYKDNLTTFKELGMFRGFYLVATASSDKAT